MLKIRLFFIFFILGVMCSCVLKSKRKISIKSNVIELKKNEFTKEATKIKSLKFYPTSTTNQIINHTYFKASYSEKDEQSEWVAYKITSENFNSQIRRTNDYREDPFVTTNSATPNDYHGNGYDMGHLAPAHAMSHNSIAMSESFYLSNICPQKASFNRGIWRSLEGKVEYWSSFKDSMYVVSGPILDNPMDQIGKNEIAVPRAFYKTLISFKDGEVRGIAFVMPNEKSKKSIYSYATSIDEVEKITGIDFYHELNKLIQDKVEANKDLKKWVVH